MAAFNTADGGVISSPHRRHRTVRFKKFLTKIDTEVAAHLDLRLVTDNYRTHKSPAIRTWLAAHPRFQVHYIPTYSSWVNRVERWFAYLTDDRRAEATTAASKPWRKTSSLDCRLEPEPETHHLDQNRRASPRLTWRSYSTNQRRSLGSDYQSSL